MNWDDKIIEPGGAESTLRQQLLFLLQQQRQSWKLFKEGEAALGHLRTRRLQRPEGAVMVQVNPERKNSNLARVDPASVAARPCFLCPANMPAAERGIAFRDLVLLPNPFPIWPRHLTIPARRHSPQAIAGRMADMLALARELGPDMAVLYNGPACGASAPDHFHFQACEAAGVPLLDELATAGFEPGQIPLTSFGRHLLICRAAGQEESEQQVDRVLSNWSAVCDREGEPPVNLIAWHTANGFQVVVFPRARHRPACFFADENERIPVSPAVLEMAGLLTVLDEAHLRRIDEDMALQIYREVSVDDERFAELTERLS